MGGSSKKEGNRADDMARQERERAASQAAAVRQQQEEAAAKLMAEIQSLVQPTAFERDTQSGLTRLGPEVEQMYRQASQGGPALNTPLGLALQERLLSDLNRNPADTFAPNLELLKGQVGQFAARRGIVGSGLELEQLGRTGVELAIQQAMAREQLRASDTERAITGNNALETIGASRRGEFGGYYQNLQSLEDARRAREIGAVSGASQTGANLRQTGNLSALERLNTGEGRALDIESSQLDYQRKARAAQQAAIGQLIGTTVGTAGGFAAGGPQGAMLGAQLGQSAFGGGGGGGNPLAMMSQFPTSAGPSSGAQLRSQIQQQNSPVFRYSSVYGGTGKKRFTEDGFLGSY